MSINDGRFFTEQTKYIHFGRLSIEQRRCSNTQLSSMHLPSRMTNKCCVGSFGGLPLFDHSCVISHHIHKIGTKSKSLSNCLQWIEWLGDLYLIQFYNFLPCIEWHPKKTLSHRTYLQNHLFVQWPTLMRCAYATEIPWAFADQTANGRTGPQSHKRLICAQCNAIRLRLWNAQHTELECSVS